ncbi:hypothetical protein HY639_05010 [Candidatus Woesearchaeota archaeon]|nr:hypothetical protein [Candidatus Woesearchaeota archaeon]
MATRLTFLGTAGENAVLYKYNKSAGGIVLEYDDQFFLIDPGPGSLVQAGNCRFNFRENTAIIISSPRIEQCSDVNAVIDAMTAAGLDKRGVLLANASVLAETSPLLLQYKDWLERVIVMEPGKKVGIEEVDMLGLPTKDNMGLGMSFATKDSIITYTGNTSYGDGLVQAYKGSDVLILNVLNPKGVVTAGYLNTDDAIRIINTVKPKLAIITHYGMKMMRAEPLYEAREIQRLTGIQVIAAKEGMTLSLTPYSSSVIVK